MPMLLLLFSRPANGALFTRLGLFEELFGLIMSDLFRVGIFRDFGIFGAVGDLGAKATV